MRRSAGLILILTLASCNATLQLDRFHKEEADSGLADTGQAGTIKYADVRFIAQGMAPHLDEYFEVRVVDKDNTLQAKVAYDGVTNVDFRFYLHAVLPTLDPPYRLDFWADHNNSGTYDGIVGGINDKDHAWRRVLDNNKLPDDVTFANNTYTLNFVHDTNFNDIATDLQGNKISFADTLLPFNVKVVSVASYNGVMVEMRIVDKASGRLVGLHRRGHAQEGYAAKVTGILDEVTTYVVSAYVDSNNDGRLSAGDPSWKAEFTSTKTGIDDQFDLSMPQSPIDTGEPPAN